MRSTTVMAGCPGLLPRGADARGWPRRGADAALPSSRATDLRIRDNRRTFSRRRGRDRSEPPLLKKALPVLFPYAVFAFLALVSWNRWIEPYVDTGRELMVPWRV